MHLVIGCKSKTSYEGIQDLDSFRRIFVKAISLSIDVSAYHQIQKRKKVQFQVHLFPAWKNTCGTDRQSCKKEGYGRSC